MRHPLVTVLVDDTIDDAVLVEFQHTPLCEHADDTPTVWRAPVAAGLAILQGIGRVLATSGATQEGNEPEFPRPAELDDPDRKRLN